MQNLLVTILTGPFFILGSFGCVGFTEKEDAVSSTAAISGYSDVAAFKKNPGFGFLK